jgi:hypothetical protein
MGHGLMVAFELRNRDPHESNSGQFKTLASMEKAARKFIERRNSRILPRPTFERWAENRKG